VISSEVSERLLVITALNGGIVMGNGLNMYGGANANPAHPHDLDLASTQAILQLLVTSRSSLADCSWSDLNKETHNHS